MLQLLQVHAEVEYPACLEIPESYLSADCSSGKVRYALSSVILHHGLKATGGHYSAHCKELGSNTVEKNRMIKVISIFEYCFLFFIVFSGETSMIRRLGYFFPEKS